MTQWFRRIIAADGLALALPTAWLGWPWEFGLAVALLAVTAIFTYQLRFTPGEDA